MAKTIPMDESITPEAEILPEIEIAPLFTLDRFLSEIPDSQAERKGGFLHLCSTEGISGNKTTAEWTSIISAYDTQPIAATWSEWFNKRRD